MIESGREDHRFYKFTDARFIDDIVEHGILRFGSLEYFAHLESIDETGNLGDRLERGAEVVGTVHFSNDTTDEEREAARQLLSVDCGPNVNLTVVNAKTVHSVPPCHIWSYTQGALEKQASLFCEGPGGYDSVLEVLNPQALMAAVAAEGKLMTKDSLVLSDLFESVHVGDVEYVNKEIEFQVGAEVPLGPFAKTKKHEAHREGRIVLAAKSHQVHDHIFVQIPEPARFFRRLALPCPTREHPIEPTQPRENLLERLRAVCRIIEVLDHEDSARSAERYRALRSFPAGVATRAATAKQAGIPLEGMELAFDRLWHMRDDTKSKAIEAMQPELQSLIWEVRLEYGVFTRFASELGVYDFAPSLLLMALTGERIGREVFWESAVENTLGRRAGRIELKPTWPPNPLH